MIKLNQKQMSDVKGGVTRKEYCTTLVQMIDANYDDVWDDSQRENASNAFEANCKDRDWNEN